MGEDEIYRSWFKKYVSCEDSLEGNILFSKLFQNLQVRSCTEAIAETVGSIMNQHLGTNRHLTPVHFSKELVLQFNLGPQVCFCMCIVYVIDHSMSENEHMKHYI